PGPGDDATKTVTIHVVPPTPSGLSTAPASPANDNAPKVKGTADPGSTVKLFTNPACSGTPAATGTAAQFTSPGIAVAVADNTITTFYASATNGGATSSCSGGVTYAEQTPAPVGPPPPQANKTVTLAPTSGSVTLSCPGSPTINLAQATSVGFQCTVDATAGVVTLGASDGKGGVQQAQFYSGAFTVTQLTDSVPAKLVTAAKKKKKKKPKTIKALITQLTLAGPLPTGCGTKKAGVHAARGRRRLWGSGHGRFRTRGRHSAATVRGTVWLTEDTCAGTRTTVKSGIVSVFDMTLKKTVTVKAPHSYLAPAKKPKKGKK
ncbi:MAG: hypothetical protein QOK25_1946, partial [Thermoleophilaceae bacterium]|nr:hypothetical protein [Thermoleophilaceae bacterium]